jgi:hypothetical protein
MLIFQHEIKCPAQMHLEALAVDQNIFLDSSKLLHMQKALIALKTSPNAILASSESKKSHGMNEHLTIHPQRVGHNTYRMIPNSRVAARNWF